MTDKTKAAITSQVRRTTWTSIVVQLVTGVVLIAALSSGRGPPFLRSILSLEAAVQTIELIFYLYIVRTLTSHESVRTMAARRYADWVLTTPVMLTTLAAFFTYDRESRGQLPFALRARAIRRTPSPFGLGVLPATATSSLGQFVSGNWRRIGLMVSANLVMLVAGFMGEIGRLSVPVATLAGFAAYVAAFVTLHSFLEKDGEGPSPTARGLFWAVAVVWAIYGLVYLLPPGPKNNAYNYIDLVAKNFFGVFLSIRVLRG